MNATLYVCFTIVYLLLLTMYCVAGLILVIIFVLSYLQEAKEALKNAIVRHRH